MFFEKKLALVVLFIIVCFNFNCQAKPSCRQRKSNNDDNNNDIDQGNGGNGGSGGNGGDGGNNGKNRGNNGRDIPEIKTESPNGKKRKKCCPYDFDSTKCRTIDDRIICGFDHNKGKVRDPSQAIDLHNGCWLRGKKLECGYQGPPFNGIRRPPAWDDPSGGGDSRDNSNRNNGNQNRNQNNHNSCRSGSGCLRSQYQYQPQYQNHQQVEYHRNYETQPDGVGVTKCLEIGQRIVCAPLRQLTMNYG